jgi:hypothetical protein
MTLDLKGLDHVIKTMLKYLSQYFKGLSHFDKAKNQIFTYLPHKGLGTHRKTDNTLAVTTS